MTKITKEVLMELFDIARSLSSTLDTDSLLKKIGHAAEQLTEAEASSIMLLDQKKEFLLFKVATGEKGMAMKRMKVKVGEGIAGWVAQQKKYITVNDVKKDPRFASSFDQSSGFRTRSILCVPLMLGEEIIGVAEVLNKKGGGFSEEDEKILESLGSLASVSISNARLVEDQKNFFIYMIELIVQAVESRDPKLTGRTWRMAQLATMLAREMGISGDDYKNIYYGALMHDIGFLAGVTSVSLGENVYTVKKHNAQTEHAAIGWEIVHKINILSGAAPIVRSHHENYDGTGFPDGLKGEAIPLGARIVALAEYVDELRMEGFDEEKIKELAAKNSGKRFDPKITETYIRQLMAKIESA